MTRPVLLQLCPFAPALEAELAGSFDICRFFELADSAAWLRRSGASVRAIATGGHVGASATLIDQLPALGIIAINGVGVDKVDLDLARARGVRVTTTPDVLTDDVADLAIGLTVALLRRVVRADAHVRAGRWPGGEMPLAHRVSGRTFGIVGMGRIGQAIARRLGAFGPVLYTGRTAKPVDYTFEPDLLALAGRVDVLVLACAANAENRHMIDAAVLGALGPSGYIVNVARGSLIDEAALIAALEDERIAGAALDVFADEPNVPPRLAALANVVLTPHIASATVETRRDMASLLMDNLRAFAAGAPLPTAVV